MTWPIAFVVAAILLSHVLLLLVIRRRDLVLGVFGGAFVVLYLLDGIATINYGSLYFSRTYARMYLNTSIVGDALIAILLTFGVFVCAYLLAAHFISGSPGAIVNERRGAVRSWAVLVPMLFLVPATLEVWRGGQLNLLLLNRQALMDESLMISLAMYFAPAGACLAIVLYRHQSSFLQKTLMLALFVLYVGASGLSGSRSAIILSTVAPIYAWLTRFQWSASGGNQQRRAHAQYLVSSVLVLGLLLAGSEIYRDATRGNQDAVSLLVSPDVTQFDALMHIWDSDFRASTYASALVFYVPRAIWLDKPPSCNSALSQEDFAFRYQSGAETTCSPLGEAYANFGRIGVPIAGIVIAGVAILALWLFKVPRTDLGLMLGLIVLFRGINVLRGDLLTTVVPIALTVGLFVLAGLGQQRAFSLKGGSRLNRV